MHRRDQVITLFPFPYDPHATQRVKSKSYTRQCVDVFKSLLKTKTLRSITTGVGCLNKTTHKNHFARRQKLRVRLV